MEKGKNMKKMIGMLVLGLVGLMAIGTGCGTIKVPDRDGHGCTELSGDLPKYGQVVRVRDVVGHETKGPYETKMLWSYYDQEVGAHTAYAKGGGFPGLSKPGIYVAVRWTKEEMYFVEVK